MQGRMRWLLALLTAFALLGAACGGDDAGDTTDDGTDIPVETTTEATDEPTDEPTDGGDATTVEMLDFEFNPADFEVASGATVTLDNVGEAPHTFTIEAEGIDEEVAAGESGEVTLDLEPGTYDYVCTFHESQGMVGTVTVA